MTKQDKSLLMNLYRSNGFEALQRLAQDIIEELHRQSTIGNTEFEYLRNNIEREGKILGIDLLLKQIEKIYDSTNRE